MKRLLNIELLKIWKSKSSRVLSVAYFVLLTFIAMIASIKFDIGPIHIDPAENGIFNFPYIYHFNAYVADYISFFLAIVIVSMMANEYSYGTLKQNLIDGLSKKEFVLSKFYTVVLFAFAATAFVFVMSLILGFCYSSYTEIGIVFSGLEYLLAFFVKLLGFFSMCLFLGILVKRSAFALGFLFVWFLFEKILYGILKFEIFDKSENVDRFFKFMPLESMGNLLVEPFSRLSVVKNVTTQIGVEGVKDYDVHFGSIIIVLIWSFLFIFMSLKLLQKRDL
ncbi:MAG: ABC transporter permease [Flavobacterium sp.]|nr:ABC transporter permease [Flavobacterium sp.]